MILANKGKRGSEHSASSVNPAHGRPLPSPEDPQPFWRHMHVAINPGVSS